MSRATGGARAAAPPPLRARLSACLSRCARCHSRARRRTKMAIWPHPAKIGARASGPTRGCLCLRSGARRETLAMACACHCRCCCGSSSPGAGGVLAFAGYVVASTSQWRAAAVGAVFVCAGRVPSLPKSLGLCAPLYLSPRRARRSKFRCPVRCHTSQPSLPRSADLRVTLV
jgi:hypothetical protein